MDKSVFPPHKRFVESDLLKPLSQDMSTPHSTHSPHHIHSRQLHVQILKETQEDKSTTQLLYSPQHTDLNILQKISLNIHKHPSLQNTTHKKFENILHCTKSFHHVVHYLHSWHSKVCQSLRGPEWRHRRRGEGSLSLPAGDSRPCHGGQTGHRCRRRGGVPGAEPHPHHH